MIINYSIYANAFRQEIAPYFHQRRDRS